MVWASNDDAEGPGSLDGPACGRMGLRSCSRCFRPTSISPKRFLLRGDSDGLFVGGKCCCCGGAGDALLSPPLNGLGAGVGAIDWFEAWAKVSFTRGTLSAQSKMKYVVRPRASYVPGYPTPEITLSPISWRSLATIEFTKYCTLGIYTVQPYSATP